MIGPERLLQRSEMVKKIVRDQFFLQQKSEPATEADRQVVEDLLDTLRANQDKCVGMAANMIGVKKQIIVVAMGPFMNYIARKPLPTMSVGDESPAFSVLL